ncbi:MAG TPA: hypothetical protein VEG38_02375 [Acidimicrobiia bacterium]|nr:hypothetical protein [Acidimicrobiia bacterium]
MSWSRMRRTIGVVALTAMSMASAAITPADASPVRIIELVEDPTGDALGIRPVPVQEKRADLTAARAIIHPDGRIELTATVAQPTDPATDAGWNRGGSYVVWGLDTTADGAADLLVWMAAAPSLSAVVLTDRLGAVEACTPAADYTPARYSVTFDGSCIGSPATFRWNTVVYYVTDEDQNTDGSGTMDHLLTSDSDISVAPGTATDPSNDVVSQRDANDPRADIVAATALYEDTGIVLTASVAQPTDPLVDPNWVDESEISWYLDLNHDDDADYVVNLHGPDLVADVWDLNNDYADRCTAVASYTESAYSVTVDPACVGTPVSFHWGVRTFFDHDQQAAIDVAPDGAMAGPVAAPPGSIPDPPVRPSSSSGYWMVTDRGDIYGFGAAHHLGNDEHNHSPRVDIEPTRSGNGYWILTAGGSVIARGDARNLGDAALRKLERNEQAAAISATPAGDGYWIFTDRGRVLPYGNAANFGDMAGTPLNGAILDSVATPSGKGYWMVGSDGGIFAFGDATFHGSTGNIKLNKPVMSMAADPDGKGYWLVASDGGIFAFDAPFYGSMGATKLNRPISGIVPGGAGYLMVGEDGGIFAFGNVPFHGSLGASPPASPVVAVALAP